jgi:hypothetical protein
MAGTGDDNSTDDFRLLCDEYAFFLTLTKSSEEFAMKLVERFLGEGDRDRDGGIRYKLWMVEALPGGLTPSPYDGAFWHSDPERGIHCTIKPWDSSARWTGPASAKWKEFDGRQTADYQVSGIRLNHNLVLEFLQSAGFLPEQPSKPAPSAPKPQAKSAPQTKESSIKARLFDEFKHAPRPINLNDISKRLNVKLKTVQNRYGEWTRLPQKPGK